jgi:DNA adenine methylase
VPSIKLPSSPVATSRQSGGSGGRPVLKWAGGKSRLVDNILPRLPEAIETYYEPFVGSGAVFFALAAERRFKRAVLGDCNAELIDVYKALKRNAASVVTLLRGYAYDRDFYYEIRARDPKSLDLAERAARTIYLNKAGFNGLYRVNRSGQFNVPFGRHANPNICDEPRLLAAAKLLKHVRLEVGDFAEIAGQSVPGDAVYFDPPYVPLSKTSNFTAYHSDVFDDSSHKRLAETFRRLAEQGVCAVLSNSDTPRTRELYRAFAIDRILVTRPINSKSTQRGNVAEILVSHHPRTKLVRKSKARALSPAGNSRGK